MPGWGAYFSRKRVVWMTGARISRENQFVWMAGARISRGKGFVWMAGARISREKGLFGWLGLLFLEKRLALLAVVRISREKGLPGWLAGLLGNPGNQSRIFIHGFRLQFLRKSCHFGQLVWGALSGSPQVSYPEKSRPVGPAYLDTCVFFGKYAKFI